MLPTYSKNHNPQKDTNKLNAMSVYVICDHISKHRELHTLNEEEIREEIKRRMKLRETRDEREQLVRQIADEEGPPPEYCDIETSDTQDPIPVEEK